MECPKCKIEMKEEKKTVTYQQEGWEDDWKISTGYYTCKKCGWYGNSLGRERKIERRKR